MSALIEAGGSAPKKPLSHIGSLDGLRGLAVLFVLVFHLSWSFPDASPVAAFIKRHLWGGWLGVDMFFALSGYLITRGLVKASAYSIGKRLKLFWARRAFRIFPLYYIVILVGTLVCLAIGKPGEIPGVGYWLYFQNYVLAFDHNPLRWTAHFWSLAIEEQFYFVWPVVVLMSGKRLRIAIALALFVFCVALRTGMILGMPKLHLEGWDTEQIAKFVYRATPTHMDGLLLGAILAMVDEDKSHPLGVAFRNIRKPLALVTGVMLLGLVVVTEGFGTYDRRVMIVGYPLLAVFFTSAISLAVDGQIPAAFTRILSGGVLAAFGRVSYGMYIFHWIFVALLAEKQEAFTATLSHGAAMAFGTGVIVVGVVLSYVLAELSYRFVEAPFLKLKNRFHD